MARRIRGCMASLVLAAVAAACLAPAASPTPAVVELPLRTAQPDPPGPVACPGALLPDVALTVDEGAPEWLVAVSADGTRTRLLFRWGTRAAWDPATGALQLRTPDGRAVVVLPGERVSFGGGMTDSGDDVFYACELVE